jgi:hypothetical protein
MSNEYMIGDETEGSSRAPDPEAALAEGVILKPVVSRKRTRWLPVKPRMVRKNAS